MLEGAAQQGAPGRHLSVSILAKTQDPDKMGFHCDGRVGSWLPPIF